jgi:hypothetical protein
VCENRVLRRIFGPKREEEEKVEGGWRRLHEELHNLYASINIIKVLKPRRMRRDKHVAYKGAMRNVYKILFRKHEWKKPLGRQRHR